MNFSAILITVIYINEIRQNGCHSIFFFSPYTLYAFLTSVPFFLTFSFLWFYIYKFFLLLFCLSIYYYYFCNMQLLSFLFFLSSLAIVYNCICIDVFLSIYYLCYINLPTVKKKKTYINHTAKQLNLKLAFHIGWRPFTHTI